jgi:hypothetical protein
VVAARHRRNRAFDRRCAVALFSDRRDVPAQRDENADGRIDERDDRIATERRDDAAYEERADAATTPDQNRTTDATMAPEQAREAQPLSTREQFDEREVARRRSDEMADGVQPAPAVWAEPTPAADDRADGVRTDSVRTDDRTDSVRTDDVPRHDTDPEVEPRSDVEDRPTVVVGPRPRASLLATLSLIVGVVAAVSVLTGVLAGPGVALGIVAALLGLGGVGATARRHVAGKSDALLGLALGVAAVIVGVLAVSGNLPWLNPDTNYVTSVHDWMQARLPWLFPS